MASKDRTTGPPYAAPVGTRDVLPPESARWEALIATFADVAERAGYGLAQSPMFEDVGVFQRMGEGTDVVRKEMYDFTDKGERHLALRPEGTASVVRAYIENRPTTPWKVWYATPVFRYEKPQSGRYRQHHQLGVEAIGSPDPDLDVEAIAMLADFYERIGLRQVRLEINTMGSPADRATYAEAVRSYLDQHRGVMAEEDQDKLDQHPLRVLDSKRRSTRAVLENAPNVLDHLGAEALEHFERVQSGLSALGIAFLVEPRLVRGLDYYTHTLFEFRSDALSAAQDTVGGGGRFDGLVEALGGEPTPAVGFGAGIERTLLTCDAEGVFGERPTKLDAFVVDTTGGDAARRITSDLRSRGMGADRSFDQRSMKAQMRAANRSGARFAVIVGSDEAAEASVTLRDLRGGAEQERVGETELVERIRQLGHSGDDHSEERNR